MGSVCIKKVCDYDIDRVTSALSEMFDLLGYGDGSLSGKNVVIKPNLVRKMEPSAAGTTHPSFLIAVTRAALSRGAASVIVAESPSGPYNETSLGGAYRVCGIEGAARECGARLNFDTSAVMIDYPQGERVGRFHIIRPLADADVIINLSKLKTHGLTTLSAAVKNLFGSVPGTEKLEMHARFPDLDDFSSMLVDLCAMHRSRAQMINIVDAVVAMEGNGPTNGKPRALGLVVAGNDPFETDVVCERLVSFEGRSSTVRISKERGLFSEGEIEVMGEKIENVRISDFVPPDSKKGLVRFLSNSRLMRLFEPRPTVSPKKCVCCGECFRSCPKKTITIDTKKRVAVIHPENCIKCFCCQELCPHDAVKIKRSLIVTNLK